MDIEPGEESSEVSMDPSAGDHVATESEQAVESKIPDPKPSTPNSRRLVAAISLLTEEFTRAESKRLWGAVTITVPFQDGDAKDIQHDYSGRVRL
jgi:hypothetical protein